VWNVKSVRCADGDIELKHPVLMRAHKSFGVFYFAAFIHVGRLCTRVQPRSGWGRKLLQSCRLMDRVQLPARLVRVSPLDRSFSFSRESL